MDKRYLFGEDVVNYDNYQPKYRQVVFEAIIKYSKINDCSRLIEIGSGTGQATEEFLKKGYCVKAIEISKNMAAYTKEKFREYSSFSVVTTEFEKYSIPDESIDLFYSATAFHWINQEVGFPKMFQALKKNGTIALFWNYPFVSRIDNPVHQAIQLVYNKYIALRKRKQTVMRVEEDVEQYEEMVSLIQSYHFKDVHYKVYKSSRVFTADQYICLLNTYSDYRSMTSDIRNDFEEDMKKAINENGGIVEVFDTIVLYLAKK